jgi:hypothetical protein
MVSVLFALAASAAPQAAEDYFPLVKGTRWTYRDMVNEYVDEVMAPVKIGDVEAVPVTTFLDGKRAESTYYSATPEGLFIVAYDAKKPLPSPLPVFKSKERSWTYSGLTQWLGGFSPIEMKGSVSPRGKRKVLGQDAETIEVRLDARIGGGAEGGTIRVRQTATYAKGIGLVRMVQTNTVNGKEQKSIVELIRYDPPRKL